MAYISRQCVECQEHTKRFDGEFRGKDETGAPFCGPMYSCDNARCWINVERERGERQLHSGVLWPTGERKRQAAHRKSAGRHRYMKTET